MIIQILLSRSDFFVLLLICPFTMFISSISHQLTDLNFFFSYGPCQTPTLGFCVQRYLQINTFKPEKFWSVRPYILQSGYELQLEWERNKLFDFDVRPLLLLFFFIFFLPSV